MSVLPPRGLVACLALLGLVGLAGAARAEPTRHRTGALAADTAPRVAWTAADATTCSRSRRKFWQEGEGWIVKTISVCR